MATISPRHRQEWLDSGIDEEIIDLNLKSPDNLYDYLCYSPKLERTNTGKLAFKHLNAYKTLRFGGWWCNGVDPFDNWEPMQWGCCKPDKPRNNYDEKPIKYEHPPKEPTRAFFLQVPNKIWQKISKLFNVPIRETDTNFWQWVLANYAIPIYICEGVKKAAALLSLGIPAIALPGIFSGYRTQKDEEGRKIGEDKLIPDLGIFAQEGRKLIFAFDRDTKQKTQRQVNIATTQTARLFLKKKCQVSVSTWDSNLGKGVDDVIVNLGETAFHELLKSNTSDFNIWQTKQLSELTYPISLNINEKYFGDFKYPMDKNFICLVGEKGTGKTENVSQNAKPHLDEGGKVLNPTHRIQLGEESANRLGIHYVSEKDSETYGINGISICINSLHRFGQGKFNPEEWVGAWIFLDECEQVTWSMLSSNLCKEYRVAILENFKEAIKIALSTGGKVILSDADLSDVSIDYIQSLFGYQLNPWIVKNHYRPAKGRRIFNYLGKTPAALVTALCKEVEKGNKCYVYTSAQKTKSKWGTKNLEKLLRSKFPYLRILRIDAESIADPEHPAYSTITRLNDVMVEFDVVIASPTLETGVSITINHFDSVWGIFQGVQPGNSARQSLGRVRSHVDRHIWCRKTGFGRIAGGSCSQKELVFNQRKVAQVNLSLLAQADFSEDLDLEFQPESLKTWAKMAARINLEMKSYRETILEGLRGEGYQIIDVDNADLPETKETENDVKTAKEENYLEERQKVTAIVSPDNIRFQQLEESRAKTERDRLQYRKGQLERRYLCDEEKNPVTEELVKRDDEGWYKQLTFHYFFENGRQFLPNRDKHRAESLIKHSNREVFLPDFNQSQLGAAIQVLEKLGFKKLLDIEQTNSYDSELIRWAEQVRIYQADVNRHLKIIVRDSDSPVAIAQKFLGLVGYKLPCLGRKGGKGKQIRLYGKPAADFIRDSEGKVILSDGVATALSDGREEIFTRWLERDLQAVSQAVTSEAKSTDGALGFEVESEDSVLVATPYKYINTIEGGYGQGGVATDSESKAEESSIDLAAGESDIEKLAEKLAIASDFAAMKNLVQQFGWENCDDATAFVNWQHKRRVIDWLKAVQLEPNQQGFRPENFIGRSIRQVKSKFNSLSESKLIGEVKSVIGGFLEVLSGEQIPINEIAQGYYSLE